MIDGILTTFKILNKKEISKLTLLTFLIFFASILEMLGIGLILPLISVFIDENNSPKGFEFIFDNLFFLNGFPSLNSFLILVLIVFLFKNFILGIINYLINTFVYNVSLRLSILLYKTYINGPFEFHINNNSAKLMHNIAGEIGQIRSVIQSVLSLTSEFIIITGIISLLIYFEPVASISVIGIILITSFIINFFIKKKIINWGRSRLKHASEVNKSLMQGLGAIKDVKIFQKENFFLKNFIPHQTLVTNLNRKHVTLLYVPRLFFEIIIVISLIILIFILLKSSQNNIDIIPVLGLFTVSAFRILPSITRIQTSFQSIRYNIPSIEKIYNELKKLDKIINNQINYNDKDEFSTHNQIFNDKNFQINFKNLSFSYKNKIILKNINISINSGTSIGIIGKSGSGKSTLIDILMGLHQIKKNTLYYNKIDISDHLNSWRSIIGYVPQQIYITDDSIKNNIAFGEDEHLIDKEKILNILKKVDLLEYVNHLDNGIDTNIGERGAKISGGQLQRIGIARALYKDPKILIFDESTSSLDIDTEKEILNSIYNLIGKKTLILVSHRLETLKRCDTVLNLEDINTK
jgi:ATP-binding cassette, subfamily B, bacterial PglK